MLVGRNEECEALDRLAARVRAGQSRVLVLRGDAGVGKTALLEHLAGAADGCRIARAGGVESEMELAYAGLHALCAPLLGSLGDLPVPQRDALNTAFGLSAGPPPDRFLVGLAVLNLLADAAEQQPLLCIVDDAQWLDRVSAQTLAFVARRLLAEPVGLVFALRDDGEPHALEGLPELAIDGLSADNARLLLETTLPGPLDRRVQEQILSEASGNPLALVEPPRGLSAIAAAGGFGMPGELPLTNRIEQGFARRLEPLPDETRRLVLLAAAEPLGNVTLLWRAAERLGIGPEAVGPAQAAGLIEIGARVRFRHPLVRSAAYRAASVPERREAHQALADATDPQLDPDRRAWHRAYAADGPDETVADELERSAGRAQARGGLAAAAAFLEQATALTPDPERRGRRALAAAEAMQRAGAFEKALVLLTTAGESPLDPLPRARAELLRAQIAFASSPDGTAASMLLGAARALEPLDDALSRETYLEAYSVARLTAPAAVAEIARAAGRLPAAPETSRAGLLVECMTARFENGYAAAVPLRQRAVRAFRADGLSPEEGLRWLWLASTVACVLWDDESWTVLAERHVELARAAGALSVLPLTLNSRAVAHVLAGELDVAASLVAELEAVQQATGTTLAPYGALGLAGWRGREREAREQIEAALDEVPARDAPTLLLITQWARAVLANGAGRHDEALLAAREAAGHPNDAAIVGWGLSELIEAATKSGHAEEAADAFARLEDETRAAGTDWALGIQARAHALVSEGEAAERRYREAIERLERTRVRGELARARLLYGEWLRRQDGRAADARGQLRIAFDLLTRIGAERFAERASGELAATGETVRRPAAERREVLTAQEALIARLAAGGHTNPEIGAQLFLSPRTVEYHLRKVFGKLDISSRRELDDALL